MRSLRPSLGSDTKVAVRAGGLLMSVGIVGGVGNLVFNLLVARGGGPSAYGAVGSLLNLVTVAGFFALGAQYAVAHISAVAPPGTNLLARAFRGVAPWLGISLVVLACAVPLTAYLHLSSIGPALLTGFLLVGTVLGAAPAGLLVGRSRFRAVAVITLGSAFLRLALGALLVRGPGTVTGALAASLVAVLGGVVARTVWVLWSDRTPQHREAALATPDTKPQHGGPGLVLRGTLGAMIAGGLWGIWALPVLAARHTLGPSEAGQFAAAQLLAGAIIWVTAPLVTAFYPTLAKGPNRQAIRVGIGATAAVAGIGLLGFGLVGPFVIPRVYGASFHPGALLLFDLGLSAMATAVITFASWSALARSHLVGPVLAGLGVAVASALVLCLVWAHSSLELGASPAIALVLGSAGMGVAKLVTIWRSAAMGDEVQVGGSARA